MMGAALLAVGMFLSSLTDNQGFAAGYWHRGDLAELLQRESCRVHLLHGHGLIDRTVCHCFAAGRGDPQSDPERESGLRCDPCADRSTLGRLLCEQQCLRGAAAPDIMTKLSLFRQFNSFVNGAFDLTAIVYYVSVMGFFLFLSVQSMEKRRYN